MKKALIVFNSRNKVNEFTKNLDKIIYQLCKLEYQVECYATTYAKATYDQVKEKASEIDLLVVAGGDGTMYEVINGLGFHKNKPKIMYVPTGTVNDLASTLKISRNPLTTLKLVSKQISMAIDSGKLNECYFNYVASFGLFTAASYTSSTKAKATLGSLAYVIDALKTIPQELSGNHYKIIIHDTGEVIEGNFSMGLIVNSTSVAGFRNAFKINEMDDGLFHLLLVPPKDPINKILPIPKLIMDGVGDHLNSNGFYYREFRKIEIQSSKKIEWNLDGEKGPVGDAIIEVIDKNIEIYTKLAINNN